MHLHHACPVLATSFFLLVYICTRAIEYIDDVTSPCVELYVTTMKCIFSIFHIKCDYIKK
jgi:hypothetical protein